jgi:flagellar basal body-associated protein FliL
MKKNDIAIIVAVAIVSGIMSYVLANFLFGGKKAYQLKAPTVEPISAEFKQPDTAYFNRNSLDITKDITIGDSSNSQPFNTK